MNNSILFTQIAGLYAKHGWKLQRILLTGATRAELSSLELIKTTPVTDSTVDALWFSRPSHEQREAWELRLLSETPYALFETFEKDEDEELREEMRNEMEARLRDYVTR
jgi:hypothetical protein